MEDKKKCFHDSEVDYDNLDKAMLESIEREAELLKQKAVLNGQIEQLRNKMLSELIELDTKKELYNLDSLPTQNHKRKSLSLGKGKDKIMVAIIVVIMLVLAIGITPSGAWFTAIQTSYVELLVDFFRVSLLGFGGFLVYKLFKK